MRPRGRYHAGGEHQPRRHPPFVGEDRATTPKHARRPEPVSESTKPGGAVRGPFQPETLKWWWVRDLLRLINDNYSCPAALPLGAEIRASLHRARPSRRARAARLDPQQPDLASEASSPLVAEVSLADPRRRSESPTTSRIVFVSWFILIDEDTPARLSDRRSKSQRRHRVKSDVLKGCERRTGECIVRARST
jgi:hypothetical protein